MCELVVPPQTAHIVPSGAFYHAIVGAQTVLEVAIQEKFFRLETTKNAHGGFGQQPVKGKPFIFQSIMQFVNAIYN